MKPDYGLSLRKSGYDASLQIVFVNWKIWYIIVLGPGRYSTFAEKDHQGERHAVSLDFDADQLQEILVKGSPTLRKWIERQICQDPITPRRIDLPETIHCGIRARLGEEQRGELETFVPLVIESVF